MAHFHASLGKLSHFAMEMAALIQRTFFLLSSSFHPSSAYLLCHLIWRCSVAGEHGAIIGSLRLTLEQNDRRFKAACQSDYAPNISGNFRDFLLPISLRYWRQSQEKVSDLLINNPPLLLPCQDQSHSVMEACLTCHNTIHSPNEVIE